MINTLRIKEQRILALGAFIASLLFVLAASLPAHAATINSELELGMSGPEVSNLQAFLAQDGTVYPEGLITGYFGPLTRAAVMRYQTKNGISAVGRVGPITLAAINGQTFPGSTGGSGGTGGSDDAFAPLISLETVTTKNACGTMTTTANGTTTTTGATPCANPPAGVANTATFTWVTNESSFGRVLYSTTWPFLYAGAPSVSGGTSLATSHSVTIPTLQPNVTYYYVLESQDISGNVTWTVAKQVRSLQQ